MICKVYLIFSFIAICNRTCLVFILGANDVTVNPNKKPPIPQGLLPPSPKEPEDNSGEDIEMSLRLICSMSGNRSKAFWEDVTDNTPMTVVLNKTGIENKHHLDQVEVERDPASAYDLRNSIGMVTMVSIYFYTNTNCQI